MILHVVAFTGSYTDRSVACFGMRPGTRPASYLGVSSADETREKFAVCDIHYKVTPLVKAPDVQGLLLCSAAFWQLVRVCAPNFFNAPQCLCSYMMCWSVPRPVRHNRKLVSRSWCRMLCTSTGCFGQGVQVVAQLQAAFSCAGSFCQLFVHLTCRLHARRKQVSKQTSK